MQGWSAQTSHQHAGLSSQSRREQDTAIIADSGSPSLNLMDFPRGKDGLSASVLDMRIAENQMLSEFYELKVLPKFSAMKSRLAQRDQYIASLKVWCSETQKTMKSQEQELSNYKTQLASLRAQMGEATERIQSQTAVHLEVSRQLDVSRNQEQDLESQLSAALAREETLRGEMQILKEQRQQRDEESAQCDLVGVKDPRKVDSRRLVAEIESANKTMQVSYSP